jgi:hypothetical protein
LHHEDAFLAAASSLGIPIVQKMSPHAAHAMWTAANININQQKIIKRYIREYLGPHVFITDSGLIEMAGKRQFKPTFSSYVYVSDEKAKHNERGELTKGWHRDSAKLLLAEVEGQLNEAKSDAGFKPYGTADDKEDWTVVVGADHGQGAWRSNMKVYTHSKRCWICQPPMKLKTTMDLTVFSPSKTFKSYIDNYVYVNQQHPSFDLRRQMSLADKRRRARENK